MLVWCCSLVLVTRKIWEVWWCPVHTQVWDVWQHLDRRKRVSTSSRKKALLSLLLYGSIRWYYWLWLQQLNSPRPRPTPARRSFVVFMCLEGHSSISLGRKPMVQNHRDRIVIVLMLILPFGGLSFLLVGCVLLLSPSTKNPIRTSLLCGVWTLLLVWIWNLLWYKLWEAPMADRGGPPPAPQMYLRKGDKGRSTNNSYHKVQQDGIDSVTMMTRCNSVNVSVFGQFGLPGKLFHLSCFEGKQYLQFKKNILGVLRKST